MEIINLTVYNKNYGKFIERVKNLIKDKNSSGFYKSVRRNVREVRHIALTRQDGITTYERIRSDFQTVRTKTQEIAKLMKVLGNLSKLPTVTPASINRIIKPITSIISQKEDVLLRKKLRAEVKPATKKIEDTI